MNGNGNASAALSNGSVRNLVRRVSTFKLSSSSRPTFRKNSVATGQDSSKTISINRSNDSPIPEVENQRNNCNSDNGDESKKKRYGQPQRIIKAEEIIDNIANKVKNTYLLAKTFLEEDALSKTFDESIKWSSMIDPNAPISSGSFLE